MFISIHKSGIIKLKAIRLSDIILNLKILDFFGLLKHFLLVNILGNDVIQTQRAMANGMTHNKYCFAMSDNNELWLNSNDIECFWVEFDDLYII